MKPTRILITGKTSYVGTCLKNYLQQCNRKNQEDIYEVEQISVRGQKWEEMCFENIDVIVHTAGLVHRKEKRTEKERAKYIEVNCSLTERIAMKAKREGVRHFIFLSSMSVYGKQVGVIDDKTVPTPSAFYGESKWLAEQKLTELAEDRKTGSNFLISILRVPMIYGEHCKGNYKRLMQLTKYSPIFPMIKNQRSMISAKNLMEQIKRIIDRKESGMYFPQDKNYVCTSCLVQKIAKKYGYKIWITKYCNLLTYCIPKSMREKLFGTLIYKLE